MEKLEEKIHRLAKYLDEEAIARAVDKEVDFVRAVLSGEAVKVKEERHKDATVIQYVRPAFRQRVIYIARVKGGVGATTLALNLAWRISEKAKTLVIDPLATMLDWKIYSDFLDLTGVNGYEGPDTVELTDNLYYLPLEEGNKNLNNVILDARRDFDVIIADLQPFPPHEILSAAMTIIYLYGGGEAEAVRLCELVHAEEERQQRVYVATKQKHPLSGEADWIYLPRADSLKVPGLYDTKTPAGKAINEIIREIWGKDFENEKHGLFKKLFQKG